MASRHVYFLHRVREQMLEAFLGVVSIQLLGVPHCGRGVLFTRALASIGVGIRPSSATNAAASKVDMFCRWRRSVDRMCGSKTSMAGSISVAISIMWEHQAEPKDRKYVSSVRIVRTFSSRSRASRARP